jgi:hypothetical protein
VTAEPTHTISQSKVQNLLGMVGDGCGSALNSFLVVVGDKSGLYATGQYSVDVEGPIVRSKAPSIAQKRNSNKAACGFAHSQCRAIPGDDRAVSVRREETAFMTLICHECAAATDWHTGTRRGPQG